MLSNINKTKGLPGESTIYRFGKIARELGVRGSFADLPTRLFMAGGLNAGQFAMYGNIKKPSVGLLTDPVHDMQVPPTVLRLLNRRKGIE
jgi:solute carrier family 25 phosphate transporter 3